MDVAAQLAADPRWQKLQDRDYVCPCCGEPSVGLGAIAFHRADPWLDVSWLRRLFTKAHVGRLFSNSDFCRVGDRYFIRAVMNLPIIGSEDVDVEFGPWVELSKEDYDAYISSEDDDALADADGWLANPLPNLPGVMGDPVRIVFRRDLRPLLFLTDKSTGFYAMQQDGITFDKVLDIYDAAGNDLRQHLMAE